VNTVTVGMATDDSLELIKLTSGVDPGPDVWGISFSLSLVVENMIFTI